MDCSRNPAKGMTFVKMHGIGNDYIYFDCVNNPAPSNPGQLAVTLSNRHTGIGGDGIILVTPSGKADFGMRIFNADGSEASMCGNGIRCVGKMVYEHGLTDRDALSIETLAGIRHLKLHCDGDGRVCSVTVDMGEPSILPHEVGVAADSPLMAAEVDGLSGVKLTAVGMGNPHGVVVVNDLDTTDVHGLGRQLEMHPMWTDRANIEFVEIISRNQLRMRVWERGSGETMACGTGTCASVVACAMLGLADREASVDLLGGTLDVRWDETDNHVYMTGGAVEVFTGKIS